LEAPVELLWHFNSRLNSSKRKLQAILEETGFQLAEAIGAEVAVGGELM